MNSGLLDFVLRVLRPCDPRPHPSQANAITWDNITRANTITQANIITRANAITWDNTITG